METITNITSAASRAIWGEGGNPDEKKDGNETLGKEPVSGELGDVKSGEPYDKGNVGKDTSLPSKTTLTSNPKPATLESSSTDPSKAAVLLPESESESRETPTNLLTTADKQKSLPSENTSTDSKPLTFSKSDPAATGTESLEEKASDVKGTTGFDEKSTAGDTTSTGTTTGTTTSSTEAPPLTGAPAKKDEGLREENVGSTGLLEEKRVKPESASEPKVGETSTSTPKKSTSSEGKKSLDGSGSGHDKEKKSLKEKIKEKLHRHKD
ncbi:hypothetical protein BKA64DRAFT_255431 [Cadophora sp. MPI-SDFR-AT-0126]|nr:hypothetical protein BKA64DRAFT_255431 [Leotiomycetes sp. MPI-SDFR-AT-0126]